MNKNQPVLQQSKSGEWTLTLEKISLVIDHHLGGTPLEDRSRFYVEDDDNRVQLVSDEEFAERVATILDHEGKAASDEWIEAGTVVRHSYAAAVFGSTFAAERAHLISVWNALQLFTHPGITHGTIR